MNDFVPYDPAAFSAARRHLASRGRCSQCRTAAAAWMLRVGVTTQTFCDACRAAYEANPRRRRMREKAQREEAQCQSTQEAATTGPASTNGGSTTGSSSSG